LLTTSPTRPRTLAELATRIGAEAVLPPGNAAHPGKVMDMLMMIFASGRERSAAEFEALLR
jgi:hypothetical protein